MKIEKINDNQIRCTLLKEDLAERHLKVSDIAYGNPRTRRLFHDILQEASFSCGFDSTDLPLMIEAIPINRASMMLLITKVEDPEELDTRFSRFTPSGAAFTDDDADSATPEDDEDFDYEEPASYDPFQKEDDPDPDAENPDDLFSQLREFLSSDTLQDMEQNLSSADTKSGSKKSRRKDSGVSSSYSKAGASISCITFDTLATAEHASLRIPASYQDRNTLFRLSDDTYMLVFWRTDCSAAVYSKVQDALSEFGEVLSCSRSKFAFLEEHAQPFIQDQALQVLKKMSQKR